MPAAAARVATVDAVEALGQLHPQHEPAFGQAHAGARGERAEHLFARGIDRAPQRHAQVTQVRVEGARLEELGHAPAAAAARWRRW